MAKYRIKQKNKIFYPQYKDGIKTMWSWEYITRPACEQYNYSWGDHLVRSSFNTFTEANKFIDEAKKKETKIFKIS